MTNVPLHSPSDENLPPMTQHVLAGQMFVAQQPTRFSTILGSCVAVCLFDLHAGIGGINHVQMPGVPRQLNDESLRWAVPGTEALIKQMLRDGAELDRLRAKVFGGACISTRRVPEKMRIGDLNISSVLAVLKQQRIRISNSSTGGNVGIKVLFDSHNGSVWVKKLVSGSGK